MLLQTTFRTKIGCYNIDNQLTPAAILILHIDRVLAAILILHIYHVLAAILILHIDHVLAAILLVPQTANSKFLVCAVENKKAELQIACVCSSRGRDLETMLVLTKLCL